MLQKPIMLIPYHWARKRPCQPHELHKVKLLHTCANHGTATRRPTVTFMILLTSQQAFGIWCQHQWDGLHQLCWHLLVVQEVERHIAVQDGHLQARQQRQQQASAGPPGAASQGL